MGWKGSMIQCRPENISLRAPCAGVRGCWLRLRGGGQSSTSWGAKGDAEPTFGSQAFRSSSSVGTNHSGHHLWDRGWESGGSVSGLVLGSQREHLWVLSNSGGEGRFFAVCSFPGGRGWGNSLTFPVFQEHRVWVKFNIVLGTWKQPECPSTEDWMKKMWYTHTHNGIIPLSHKKENEIMPFTATWMDLE